VLRFIKECFSLGLDYLFLSQAVSWLRKWISCLIVTIIILFCLSGGVSHVIIPCVFGGCPGTVTLNSNVVDSSADFHKTIFSPMSTPGVADKPVFLISVVSIAHYFNIMNRLKIASRVAINAACVSF